MEQRPEANGPPAATPREDYTRRLSARREVERQEDRRGALFGNARFAAVPLTLLVLWLIFGPVEASPWLLAVPILLFVVTSMVFDRHARARFRAAQAAAFYERGLARVDGQWMGKGEAGTRYLDEDHPNAQDLDLFGPGSLFQLLCTARTLAGQDTLAAWLLRPSPAEEIRLRQEAVAELRPRLDLREDLSLLGAAARTGVDFRALAAWGSEPPVLTSRILRALTGLLAVLNVVVLSWFVLSVSPVYLLPASLLVGLYVLLVVGFTLWLLTRVHRVLGRVERRGHDVAMLSGVLARLEAESFTSPHLRKLGAELASSGTPPSHLIGRLVNLLDWLNSNRNVYFLPFRILLLWDLQLAFAIEAWRARAGPGIAGWLHAVGEFEALCALAGYAYENPEDVFPEIVADGACFDGERLGHPLLPRDRCIRNDLHLGGEPCVLVVSGSNMSGKSTMLRTVGVNTVLALAGAPVRATRLRLSPLVVGATLRIQDSLQAGRSRFFAEIKRVRQLVDLAHGSPPLLFLLDEIFHGTNSHDRCLGAEAVVCGLVDRGALGLVTTHDLALTQFVERLGARAANVHFEDRIENGEPIFDYRMRPGIVQHSNALALMRAVGLRV